MTDRQPSPDDPWWTEAPLSEVFAPLTSERVGPTETRPFYGNGRTDAAKTSRMKPTSKKRQKLTSEKRARIIEAVKAGRLYRQIATEIGVGESSVQRIAGEEGIGRGQGYQGTDTGTCDRCSGPLGMQNKTGTCRRCQRGRR